MTYELPRLDIEIPAEWQYARAHRREAPAACPLCHQPLRAAPIGGLAPTRVALLSELQPKRRKTICPECERVLFTELSGLVQNADPFCPAHVHDRDASSGRRLPASAIGPGH
jgi:hypothetical protein